MADLRLLRRSLAGACGLAVVLLSGCAVGPVWARRVEGQVVHASTGEPVPGAEVFSLYQVAYENHGYSFDWRWTTTDAAGRFAFPGHVAVTLGPLGSDTDRYPTFEIVHPDYGSFARGGWLHERNFPGWRSMRFEIDPGPYHERELVRNPRHWPSLCSGAPEEACDRLCEVAYGSVQACYDAGRYTPEERGSR